MNNDLNESILWLSVIIIVILIFLTSCGNTKYTVSDSKHTVGGRVVIDYQWNLDQFKDLWREDCEKLYYVPSDVDKCVQDKTDELIGIIKLGLSNNEEK